MRIVVTPWYKLSKFLLIGFGVPFTLAGVVLFLVLDGNLAFLLNGILWMIIGSVLLIKGVFHQHKLEMLKTKGLYYEGTVVNIIPAHSIRIGSYVTARVECVYKTEHGNQVITSGYHLLSPFDRIENLYAYIYMDHSNSAKYIVELFRTVNQGLSNS